MAAWIPCRPPATAVAIPPKVSALGKAASTVAWLCCRKGAPEGRESPPPRPTTESLPPACAEAGEPHGAAGALGRWIDAKRAKYGPDWWRLPEHDAGAVAWANARYGKSKESKAVPWTERDIKLVEVCIRLQREAPADHARLCPNCLRPEYLARKSQS
jgi:hypothetical protein